MLKRLFAIFTTIQLLAACSSGFKTTLVYSNLSPAVLSDGPRLLLGALGDSISRGYDISSLGQEDLGQNWVTGSELPGSLVNEIKTSLAAQSLGVKVDAQNLAVSGDTVLGTASTFAAKAKLMATLNAQVVTVEIGANDVCAGSLATAEGAAAFRDKMVTVLNTLKNSAHPPQVIAVLSIPHIFALTQIQSMAGTVICQNAWQLLCPNLQAGEAAFEAQWAAANQALSDAVTAVGGPAVYDGGAAAGADFSAEDVSQIDCFHPSAAGQTKIAAMAWLQLQPYVDRIF